MRKYVFIIIIFPVLLFLVSCGINDDRSSEYLSLASWNVQNIFNATQDGNEYSEYLPTSGWTAEYYNKRLKNLSAVCCYEPLSDTDVFILNEVENASVVEDILKLKPFSNRGFRYYAVAGESGGAIKTAVVSRIPIVNARIHNISDLRPILQVEISNQEERIFILAIHAKSNREGVEETSPSRLVLAQTLNGIIAEIQAEDADALILIAGDFNESYDDNNMMCDARNSSKNAPIKLLPDFKSGCFYCPWMDADNNMQTQGSYCYKGVWECYDNILISSAGGDKNGWEFDSAGVVFQGILQTTDNKPNAYRRDLLTGVSDHLPVWVKFRKN